MRLIIPNRVVRILLIEISSIQPVYTSSSIFTQCLIHWHKLQEFGVFMSVQNIRYWFTVNRIPTLQE